MAKRNVSERFFEKVDASGDCWEWTASFGRDGYGQFGVDGKVVKAHRWVWEHLVGPIPNGLEIDHLCRKPRCVNPDHLEPVTHAENMRRGFGNRRKTHCPQGHPYSGPNLFIDSRRFRCCRLCMGQQLEI